MSAVWIKNVRSVYESLIFSDIRLEDKRRVALHIALSLVGIIFLFIFSILATIQKNIPLATADIVAAMILVGNLLDLYIRKKRFASIFYSV